MQVVVLFLMLLVYQAAARQVDFCYAEDDDPYLYMATKTSYHFVHGGKTRFQIVPDCQPVQIWMMSRHGARYPKPKTITKLQDLPKLREQIVHNHEHRGNGHLCDRDLDNLKLWNPNPNLSMEWAQRLTPKGAEDSMFLARRLQSNFPELLQPNYMNITSQNYKFRSTTSERTRASMEAFMEGLFRSKNAVNPVEPPRENDTLLKAYKNCTNWQDGLDGEASTVEERDKFVNGPEMTNVVYNISRRLGFQYSLLYESIQMMYDMCRFEKAWNIGDISVWCAPFTEEELRVFEYAEDIYYYYSAGSGRKINSLLGCSPLQDMFNRFKELENGDLEGKPKGIFYFTHTVTMLSLLTAMGIGKDHEHLLATNYKQMARRQFRTSIISPFNANLAAVFYRCNSAESPNKVMFYLEEKPLLYEGCQVGLCDWEYLKTKLGNVVSQCDINFCWNGSGSAINQAWNLIAVLIPTFLLVLSNQWNQLSCNQSG